MLFNDLLNNIYNIFLLQITMDDFQSFDHILGMDELNLSELQAMADLAGKSCHAQVGLLGTYLENEDMEIIKDPYFVSLL